MTMQAATLAGTALSLLFLSASQQTQRKWLEPGLLCVWQGVLAMRLENATTNSMARVWVTVIGKKKKNSSPSGNGEGFGGPWSDEITEMDCRMHTTINHIVEHCSLRTFTAVPNLPILHRFLPVCEHPFCLEAGESRPQLVPQQ